MEDRQQEIVEYSYGERSIREYGSHGNLTKKTHVSPDGRWFSTEYHPNGERAVESLFTSSGALLTCHGFDTQGRRIYTADYHGDGSLRAFVECEYDADGQGFEQRTFNDIGEATTWTRGEIHQGRKRILECKGLLNEEQRHRMRERHLVRLKTAYPHLAEKLQALWERAEEERQQYGSITL